MAGAGRRGSRARVEAEAGPRREETPAAGRARARRTTVREKDAPGPEATASDGTTGAKRAGRRHYHVYVVYLKNPSGDGKAGYYVGMTGLSPDERLANHLAGVKAARVVRKHGVRLVPSLYEHLNPMTYDEAVRMEEVLAESLRRRGYQVFGGH